jgi:hypothetical protein
LAGKHGKGHSKYPQLRLVGKKGWCPQGWIGRSHRRLVNMVIILITQITKRNTRVHKPTSKKIRVMKSCQLRSYIFCTVLFLRQCAGKKGRVLLQWSALYKLTRD